MTDRTMGQSESSKRFQPPGELRSFGRKRGRGLSQRQKRLMAELLPLVRVDLGKPAPVPLAASLFPTEVMIEKAQPERGHSAQPTSSEIWLEIGFGGAEHLIWQSQHNPDVGLIGCEPFEEGVVKALTAIEENGLTNIRLHDGDARDILRWLPDGSVNRVFVLFPDPWPKARHTKRRLVTPATLVDMARVMKAGAELRIGTDIAPYARQILLAAMACPELEWLARRPADWRVRPNDWPQSRYEAKGLKAGRRCYYFRFMRRDGR